MTRPWVWVFGNGLVVLDVIVGEKRRRAQAHGVGVEEI
jgi:hypothetical protein